MACMSWLKKCMIIYRFSYQNQCELVRKGFRITVNILFLGDVVAEDGLATVVNTLATIKKQYEIDFTIVNAENSAHGKGITQKIYQELSDAGADVITLGNHAFAKKEIISSFDQCPFMIRPANIEPLDVGNSVIIREIDNLHIAVINLLGNVFMTASTAGPIEVMEELLKEIDADIIIVDLHGEATSEKILFAEYFADRITAIFGTHTHVQTADERIIRGCAFISDVGMCGPYDSVLGRNINELINHVVKHQPTVYMPAKGKCIMCGCVVKIDETTCRATSIERIRFFPNA